MPPLRATSDATARDLMPCVQEESLRRREALRLETEKELRNRRMELEREMDAEKLQARSHRMRFACVFS